MSIKEAQLKSYAHNHNPYPPTSPLGMIWLAGFEQHQHSRCNQVNAYKLGYQARVDSGLWL